VGGPTVVRFNGFALDAGRRIVSRGGRRVHLTRKAFDLLTILNDRPVIEPTRLSDGDAIQIGPAIFVFRVMDTVATTETAGTNEPR
jgi:hypothetical protein